MLFCGSHGALFASKQASVKATGRAIGKDNTVTSNDPSLESTQLMELVSSRVGVIPERFRKSKGRGTEEPIPPYVYQATLSHFDYRMVKAQETHGLRQRAQPRVRRCWPHSGKASRATAHRMLMSTRWFALPGPRFGTARSPRQS